MVTVTSAHICGMNLIRVTQITLLAVALVLGLSAPVFNGLTILALILAATPLAIARRWGSENRQDA